MLLRMVKKIYIPLLVLGIMFCHTACKTYDFGGMLSAGSSVQERFKNSMTENYQHFYPSNIICPTEYYSFIVATDMHIKDTEWAKVENFINTAANGNYLMTLLLGDYMYEAGSSLDQLANTISSHHDLYLFPAIGNHEVYKEGYQEHYKSTFGPTCYYFTVTTPSACDLFICLDSANGTLGNLQFDWLQKLLARERNNFRNCTIFTHANFFNPPGYIDVISSYPIEEQMKLLNLFAQYRVTTVFTGHSHLFDKTILREVTYITLDPWAKGKYATIECDIDGNISLKTISTP